FLPRERPHPSFGKNASVFTEIHLPPKGMATHTLNRQLRCLGKALGGRISSINQNFPFSKHIFLTRP
ncbi:MAG: hypothetical protein IJ119_01460, partial [Clostridia bacterium]|nr:hypothetical protein [Clostridia bacterium]